MEILHFNSQKERLAYLKGEFEEIKPQEVISTDEPRSDEEVMKALEAECGDCPAWDGTDCTRLPYTEGCLKDEPKEEPKQKKKASKKGKKDGKVQAE